MLQLFSLLSIFNSFQILIEIPIEIGIKSNRREENLVLVTEVGAVNERRVGGRARPVLITRHVEMGRGKGGGERGHLCVLSDALLCCALVGHFTDANALFPSGTIAPPGWPPTFHVRPGVKLGGRGGVQVEGGGVPGGARGARGRAATGDGGGAGACGARVLHCAGRHAHKGATLAFELLDTRLQLALHARELVPLPLPLSSLLLHIHISPRVIMSFAHIAHTSIDFSGNFNIHITEKHLLQLWLETSGPT